MIESPPDPPSPSVKSTKALIVLKRIAQILVIATCLLLLTAVVTFVELRGWVGVEHVEGWRNWFTTTIRAGWFAFVLVRVVVFFLIALVVRLLWRWPRTLSRSIAILIVVSLVTSIVTISYSPIGVYGVVDKIEDPFDHYFVFAGGKVEFVRQPYFFILGDKVDSPEEADVQWGHYGKTANGWIMIETGEHGRRFKLKSSWFGIRMCNIEAPGNCILLGRRILPFLRPDWMPDWLQ